MRFALSRKNLIGAVAAAITMTTLLTASTTASAKPANGVYKDDHAVAFDKGNDVNNGNVDAPWVDVIRSSYSFKKSEKMLRVSVAFGSPVTEQFIDNNTTSYSIEARLLDANVAADTYSSAPAKVSLLAFPGLSTTVSYTNPSMSEYKDCRNSNVVFVPDSNEIRFVVPVTCLNGIKAFKGASVVQGSQGGKNYTDRTRTTTKTMTIMTSN